MASKEDGLHPGPDLATASSNEDDLKGLLHAEAQRRHSFSERLLTLLSRLEQQHLKEKTGGDKATVSELLKRVESADAFANKCLQQCLQKVCDVADVSFREKPESPPLGQMGGNRHDSGYCPSTHTSADITKLASSGDSRLGDDSDRDGFSSRPPSSSSVPSEHEEGLTLLPSPEMSADVTASSARANSPTGPRLRPEFGFAETTGASSLELRTCGKALNFKSSGVATEHTDSESSSSASSEVDAAADECEWNTRL